MAKDAKAELSLEERVNRIRLQLTGGEYEGQQVTGVLDTLAFLEERLAEVEKAVVEDEKSGVPALPEVLVAGVTPADIFTTAFRSMIDGLFQYSASVMLDRNKRELRRANLANCVEAAFDAVLVVSEKVPAMKKRLGG
jgi:hypothetical protein